METTKTSHERYDAATLPGLIFEAFDVKTGCLIRLATDAERAAFLSQPCVHPAMRTRFVVGDVAVDARESNPGPDNQYELRWSL